MVQYRPMRVTIPLMGKDDELTAIERIHEFARFGSRLGLERMRHLLRLLGDPQKKLRVIHVAGTNGKGSVCRFLYSALRQGGYKAGIFTSPFVVSFYERIEYDGSFITEDELEEITPLVLDAAGEMIAEGEDSPTEFEILTAIAFVFFAGKNPDFVIMEVGLGGLGDSTNAIDEAVISVITSISFDHMEQLGGTIAEIAAQKAGIIKRGCPVVCGAGGEAEAVARERAAELDCPFVSASEVKVENIRVSLSGTEFDAAFHTESFPGMSLSMIGAHQVENAAIAIAVLQTLRETQVVSLDLPQIREGLRKSALPGRVEVICRDPVIIADGAHNPGGAEALAASMEELFRDKRILVIAGMLKDKDIRGIISPLCRFAAAFVATEPDSERKLAAEELAEKIKSIESAMVAAVKPDPSDAMDYAISAVKSGEYDMIVAAGSLYLVGNYYQ